MRTNLDVYRNNMVFSYLKTPKTLHKPERKEEKSGKTQKNTIGQNFDCRI